MTMKHPRTLRLRQLVPPVHPLGEPIIPERMIWTGSSIKLFRKCKRKFYWKYVMRLSNRAAPLPLLIGQAFHGTLEEWYVNRRSDMRRIVRRRLKEVKAQFTRNVPFYDQDEVDAFHVACDSFAGMMIGYADNYNEDRTDWDIYHVRAGREHRFQVDMGDFDFAGKIDMVARLRTRGHGPEEWFLVEHKTVNRLGEDSGYVERLALDTQIRGYLLGARTAIKRGGLGHPTLTRVLYDILRKPQLRRKSNEPVDDFADRVAADYGTRPAWYFRRERLRFYPEDLDIFEHELRQTHKEYTAIVRGPDPKDPRAWTPNDCICTEYFRLCEYHGLCTIGLDKGTTLGLNRREALHEELEIELD